MEINSPSALAYIALQVLCSRKNSLVPEILYILSHDQVLDFVRIFGGETIKVPKAHELERDLLSAICAYHVYAEDRTWDYIASRYHLNGNVIRSVRTRVEQFIEGASNEELEFLKSIKGVEDV